jgi:hypothetical protein
VESVVVSDSGNPAAAAVTGDRVVRGVVAKAAWSIVDVPDLRIVPDELWNAVKRLQASTRERLRAARNVGVARRPVYLFSGLTHCGLCGRGFTMYSKTRLACSGARDRGVETRVLRAMQDRLWNHELFGEFCDEFVKETNQIRMEHRAARTTAKHELAKLEMRRKRLIELLIAGSVHGDDARPELDSIRARREVLDQQLRVNNEQAPPLLHSEMGRLYCEWVTQTRAALTDDDHRAGATTAIRAMVEDIVLTPHGQTIESCLKGT